MRNIIICTALLPILCYVAAAQVGAQGVGGLSFPSSSRAGAATNGSVLGVENVGFLSTAQTPESHSPPNVGGPAIKLAGYADSLGYMHYPRYAQRSNRGAVAFPLVPSIYGPYGAHLSRFPLGLCLYFIPRQLSQ